jgi:hypothetical protein
MNPPHYGLNSMYHSLAAETVRNGAAHMDHSHAPTTTPSGAILCNVINFVTYMKIICTQKYSIDLNLYKFFTFQTHS